MLARSIGTRNSHFTSMTRKALDEMLPKFGSRPGRAADKVDRATLSDRDLIRQHRH